MTSAVLFFFFSGGASVPVICRFQMDGPSGLFSVAPSETDFFVFLKWTDAPLTGSKRSGDLAEKKML